MPNTFVIAMGVGTVFFGLICIIILSSLMSAICTKLGKREPAAPAPAPAVQAGIPGEVVAAISAAVTAASDTPVAVRSITKAPARRNGWALAGVYSYTEPF